MNTLYEQFREQNPNFRGFVPTDCMSIDNNLRAYSHSSICEKSLIMLLQRMQDEINELKREIEKFEDWKRDAEYEISKLSGNY